MAPLMLPSQHPNQGIPPRRNAGIISTNVVEASSHPLAEDADADPIVAANLASLAVKVKKSL